MRVCACMRVIMFEYGGDMDISMATTIENTQIVVPSFVTSWTVSNT